MQTFSSAVFAYLALAATSGVFAVTITEPSESVVINPQQPFTIKWTSNADDPKTLTFTLTGAGDFAITQYKELAANVQTSAGSVEIPANTIGTFGQYKIEARDASSSSVLTTSSDFYLAQGNDNTMSITSNNGASGDGTGSGTTAASTQLASATTGSGDPQISTVTGPDGTSIVLSGTVTPTQTSATTSRGTGSTVGGQTGTTTISSGTPTETPNAQVRVGGDSNAMILSMAGMVAGLVALVA